MLKAAAVQRYLAGLFDKRVSNVANLIHIHLQTITRIALILTFENGANFIIRNAADGVGLVWEDQIPEEFSLSEFGKVNLSSAEDYDPDDAKLLIGKRLTDVHAKAGPDGSLRRLKCNFEDLHLEVSNEDDNLIITLS
jgi:hypothetical protein